jgi:hypothetical protein
MVSLWRPVLCPRFNENVAAISLPAQTDLGNILEIATPLVSQTVVRSLLVRGFGMVTVLIVEDQEQILILAKSFS